MTDPSESDPNAAATATDGPRVRGATLVWLVLLAIVVLVRLPVLVPATWSAAANIAPAVRRGVTLPAAERIQRVTGIGPAFVTAVREALPDGGRLVLYSPYVGTDLEFLLRLQFERTKNLLYPRPRDVHFASGAPPLLEKLEPALAGRLLVLDGTQGDAVLAIGGRYELLHTESIGGGARLRLWRWLGPQ